MKGWVYKTFNKVQYAVQLYLKSNKDIEKISSMWTSIWCYLNRELMWVNVSVLKVQRIGQAQGHNDTIRVWGASENITLVYVFSLVLT